MREYSVAMLLREMRSVTDERNAKTLGRINYDGDFTR